MRFSLKNTTKKNLNVYIYIYKFRDKQVGTTTTAAAKLTRNQPTTNKAVAFTN